MHQNKEGNGVYFGTENLRLNEIHNEIERNNEINNEMERNNEINNGIEINNEINNEM